jgi:predicted heme/steroid binding protein/uncharacterized membrane protein
VEEIDPKDLSKFDGKEGNPVYIGHQGRVIDVSASKLWKGGLHMNRHHAGNDLTTDIQAAPHGLEVLNRYPQVALLRKERLPEPEIPKTLSLLLQRFPILRRHPHPMTIHFPIVFMVSAPLFTVLYLLTGVRSFETTALHCLVAGLFFIPIGMGTGYYTWWLNYQAKPLRPVKIKQKVSLILFGTALTATIWRLNVPDVLIAFRETSGLYLVLMSSLLPLVIVMGWFGAQMTFPVEKAPGK